ncbi:TonB-dependent receptor [Parabacteroides sp. Marseille-P3160]|uniref:SusC/RagA family TonB-linked outer membrane protein n=1 Tax=Parabacteroides sp. Marseille-P3160 TaxID=1917887 RepID=UPI0009BA796A|nr:TonB-dependent receptor [Parabacteroides sp. Marseille-P3160]
MNKINFKCLFFCLLFSIGTLSAQEISVSGSVVDDQDSPLIGVSVMEKGTSNGTITDLDGKFSIRTKVNSVLVFSYIGYTSQNVVAKDSNLKIILKLSSVELDDIVVVAYGTQSRRTLTSSVSKVNTKELENMSVTNVMDALKGKVAGARIYSNSGQPGEAPNIVIRGGSSINKSNSPLILVDGFERGYNEINPNDIESIQVLKDAASTALYGSRASNGIILITTKGGSSTSGPKVTFQADFSLQNIERYYDLCNAEEYLSIIRPSVARGPNAKWLEQDNNAYSGYNTAISSYTTRYLQSGENVPVGWKSMIDPLDPSKTLVFQDNDMLDIAFNSALRQNYYLSVDGGDSKIKYSTSVGFTDDEGVAMSTGWKRFSARGLVDYAIRKNLRIFSNIGYQRSTTEDYSSQANAISRSLYLPPTQKIYNDDGSFSKGVNATSSPLPWWTNVYQRETVLRQTTISGGLDWGITDYLMATATATSYFSSTEFDGFQRANEFNALRPATSTLDDTERTQYEGLLKYNNRFGNHNLSGFVGLSYMNTKVKTLDAAAQGASSDKIETLNAAPEKTNASTTKTEEVLASVFAKVSYDYNNKYLLSASLRRDGSSRFGTNHKWAYFPGVSVGWVISEENFLQKNNILSFLKLRSSIGQTGNNAVGLYTAQGAYAATYKYNNVAGIVNTAMPNQNLTWETTTQIDAGLDVGLFKDRVLLNIDVFNKKTDDLIFSKPLPNTSGFSSIETNVGSVRFYGFDVELTSKNVQEKDFSWETSFAWGFVKNKVVSLPDNGQVKNRIGGTYLPDGKSYGGIAEGESLYRIYGYKVDYLIDTEEQAANARYDELARGWDYKTQTFTKGRKFAGDYEWCDRNGDGKITEVDQFELGVTVPHSTGGLTNTFTYKDFSLRIYLDWAIGHTVLDSDFRYHMMSTFNGNSDIVREALSAWKQPGDAARTKWARIAAHDSNENWNYRRESDIITFKGDYLCIRDVSLGYNIPNKLMKKAGVQNATVFLSGNNLHYFTAVQATPPEVGTINNANTGYPPIRRFSLGFKVQF